MLVHLESQRIFPVTTVRSFSMTFTFNDLVDALHLKKNVWLRWDLRVYEVYAYKIDKNTPLSKRYVIFGSIHTLYGQK